MSLIKTSIYSAISTFSKMAMGLIAIKIIAHFGGPSGVGVFGQFVALLNIFTVVAGGGIGLGVIKYVSEYSNEAKKLKLFLENCLLYTLFFSLITLILGLIFRKHLAVYIFGNADEVHLIVILSIVQFCSAVNLLLIAVLNGYKLIAIIMKASILSSLVTLVLTFVLAFYYGIDGALWALLFGQVTSMLITILAVCRLPWFKYFFSKYSFKKLYVINLSKYSLMNIVSTLTVPVSQIIVRYDISKIFSWQSVGYWQAVIRVADAYLVVITLSLTAYYLPKLSELTKRNLLIKEILYGYKIIVPVVLGSTLMIFFVRDLIILVLYNPSFMPARSLFLFQFIGDFFRICGWLFTYLLLAKSFTKTYIVTEIILSVVFILISHFFIRSYGLVGVTYAFSLTYFFYWLMMASISLFILKHWSKFCVSESTVSLDCNSCL